MSRIARHLVISVGVLLSVGALSPAGAQELSGTVKDVCGRDLPGTTVTAVSEAGTTTRVQADSGRYSFGDLTPGVWTIGFQLPGYQPEHHRIVLSPGIESPRQDDVRLLRARVQLELSVNGPGRAVDAPLYQVAGVVRGRDGQAVAGATVRLQSVSGSSFGADTEVCMTDDAGRYEVGNASSTPKWRVSVRADGYVPYTSADLAFASNGWTTLDIQLQTSSSKPTRKR